MKANFYLSSLFYLLEDGFKRLLLNCGVSDAQMALLNSGSCWSIEDRTRVRRVIDVIVAGAMDMQGMPKIDVPAETVAAVVSVLVNPVNWMTCAAWMEGLRPARDLLESEETVQIQRVGAGKMYQLICACGSAQFDDPTFAKLAEDIRAKILVQEA